MYEKLVEQMKTYESVVLGLSGGVDSSLVACAGKDAGIPMLAVTVRSPLHPREEGAQSACFCHDFGIPHMLMAMDTLRDSHIAGNTKTRCYHCKRRIFSQLKELAKKQGYEHVVDGTHADDHSGYRPGLKALLELGVKSPLAELRFTKEQVRRLAAEKGLPMADRPSAPCLATRFPYGEALTEEKLRRVEEAEKLLREAGLTRFRARVHGDILRIEAKGIEHAFAKLSLDRVARLKQLGYAFITLDLSGYQPGCFDEEQT